MLPTELSTPRDGWWTVGRGTGRNLWTRRGPDGLRAGAGVQRQPEAGRVGKAPALVGADLEAARPGRRRGAGSRRGRPSPRATRRRPRRRSRSTSPPCSRGTSGSRAARARSSIRFAGPTPPHFASLTLTPAVDADEGVEVLDRDGALVGDDRQRRALLEPAQLVEPPGRERLLDELHAEAHELRQQRDRVLGRPAGVRVDADRAAVDRADGLERLEVGRAARP